MSANTYTTDDLVDDILLLGHVPIANATFTTSKLLRIATLELQTNITKQILSTRGGYYMTYLDYDLASDGLYSIPSDAIGGALANVELVQGPTIVPVNQIEESEQFSTIAPTSTSYGFFMKGNYVQILPTPNIGTPRLWFFKRTSNLIATSEAAQITAINGAVYTVSSVPSTMVADTDVDICADQPPFNLASDDVTITDVTGSNITLSESSSTAVVGDWISLHNQTPVPQIPVEFQIILAQRVVCKIYELQGYLPKLEEARKILKEYEESTFALLTPRVQSQTKIVNAINGGFLAGSINRATNFPAGRTP